MNIEKEPIELIQIKRKTYDRIKDHSRIYSKDFDSFDEIIVRLLNFYEGFDDNRRY